MPLKPKELEEDIGKLDRNSHFNITAYSKRAKCHEEEPKVANQRLGGLTA